MIKKNNDNGSVIILFIVILMFFMLGGAIAIDYGMISAEKANLQKAVDAATLAGAQKMIDKDLKTTLTLANVNSTLVTTTVHDYLGQNNEAVASLKSAPTILIESAGSNALSLKVTAIKNVQTSFASMFNVFDADVTCSAKIQIGTAGKMSGLRPFGLTQADIDATKGKSPPEVILREGSGNKEHGNFNLLDLDGKNAGGNNDISSWITNGYDDYLIPGVSIVLSETGIKSAYKDIENLIKDGPKIIIVPIVEYLGPLTGPTDAKVLSFAAIEISYRPGKNSGDIIGILKEENVNADLANSTITNNGVYTIKMIE